MKTWKNEFTAGVQKRRHLSDKICESLKVFETQFSSVFYCFSVEDMYQVLIGAIVGLCLAQAGEAKAVENEDSRFKRNSDILLTDIRVMCDCAAPYCQPGYRMIDTVTPVADGHACNCPYAVCEAVTDARMKRTIEVMPIDPPIISCCCFAPACEDGYVVDGYSYPQVQDKYGCNCPTAICIAVMRKKRMAMMSLNRCPVLKCPREEAPDLKCGEYGEDCYQQSRPVYEFINNQPCQTCGSTYSCVDSSGGRCQGDEDDAMRQKRMAMMTMTRCPLLRCAEIAPPMLECHTYGDDCFQQGAPVYDFSTGRPCETCQTTYSCVDSQGGRCDNNER